MIINDYSSNLKKMLSYKSMDLKKETYFLNISAHD